MADTRNVRQTDDLRLRGLLSGSGMGLGGYMFNSGEEEPTNMPLSAFERGITRAPLSSFNEIDAPDVGDDPMVTGGVEDDIFDMLSQIMVGTQGTIEGLNPRTIAMIRGSIDPSAGTEELQEIAQEIADAGGYEAWLAQQDEVGPFDTPPTDLVEEPFEDIIFDPDFIDVDPDMPIDIPPPTLPPREESEGEGEGAGAEAGEGTGEDGGRGSGTGESNGNGEDTPRGGGRGGGSIGYDPVGQAEQDRFPVIFNPFASGSSGDSGGGGGGGGQPTGMLDSRFKPYMASIGYAPVAIPKAILPQAPIVSSLFSEYLA